VNQHLAPGESDDDDVVIALRAIGDEDDWWSARCEL